jgi:hypothetical protein
MSALPRTAPAWDNEVTWRERCEQSDRMMRDAMAGFYRKFFPHSQPVPLRLITPLIPKPQPRPVVVSALHCSTVLKLCRVLDIEPGILVSDSRNARLVSARWAAMLALRGKGWSQRRLGAAMGGRDGATVRYGLARAESLLATDAEFAALVRRIEAVL